MARGNIWIQDKSRFLRIKTRGGEKEKEKSRRPQESGRSQQQPLKSISDVDALLRTVVYLFLEAKTWKRMYRDWGGGFGGVEKVVDDFITGSALKGELLEAESI